MLKKPNKSEFIMAAVHFEACCDPVKHHKESHNALLLMFLHLTWNVNSAYKHTQTTVTFVL